MDHQGLTKRYMNKNLSMPYKILVLMFSYTHNYVVIVFQSKVFANIDFQHVIQCSYLYRMIASMDDDDTFTNTHWNDENKQH